MLPRRALPAAHIDRNATTPVTDLVHHAYHLYLDAIIVSAICRGSQCGKGFQSVFIRTKAEF
jgi:hypothetical protein